MSISKLDSFLKNNYKKFCELNINGMNLHNKSHIQKLNEQIKSIGFDFKCSFTKTERDLKYSSLKGQILFNYDVQAELSLIHEKCKEHGLRLTLYHDKEKLNGVILLFLQKKIDFPSIETKDYIICSMDTQDSNLLENIFIIGLAAKIKSNQKDVLSSYFDLDYNEVNRKMVCKEFDENRFRKILSNRSESSLVEGSWFQLIERKFDGSFYLRLFSDNGKRTFSTVWLNTTDRCFVKYYIPAALKKLSTEGDDAYILSLRISTEQTRGGSEVLLLPPAQIEELAKCLDLK